MSHLCDIGTKTFTPDGKWVQPRWCPTLPDDCPVCCGLVCPEHGCNRCGRKAVPDVKAS